MNIIFVIFFQPQLATKVINVSCIFFTFEDNEFYDLTLSENKNHEKNVENDYLNDNAKKIVLYFV